MDTPLLHVMVGNDTILECRQQCVATPLLLQGHEFRVTFHLLPISGADIVLGIDWLKQFGPILTDHTTLSMKFTHNGTPVELSADVPLGPSFSSAKQIHGMIHTGSTSSFFHLSLHQPSPPPEAITTHTIFEISHILSQYSAIFLNTSSFPPSHDIAHHIILQPSTGLVNVRPYRYPFFQKAEIEKQVSDLLLDGLIWVSHSPFSSPVLLVKKKDGSWRMCVDYRALNAVTVRDRFPLLTIDELLDDLGKASWFSKLDLKQGFHQILMAEEDIPKIAFRTHRNHCEYKVMPFGLRNAPFTFQAIMNSVL